MIVDEIPESWGIRCPCIEEKPNEYRFLSDVTVGQERNISFSHHN